jgi:hypothetical protein
VACLNLKEVVVSPYLTDLLQDPTSGLMRPLFEPLFALLQGKINIEAFEQTAPNLVETSAKTLLHKGYVHWTTLSLINLIAPDEAHLVSVIDDTDEPDLTSAWTFPGWFTEELPKMRAVEADRLPLHFSMYTRFQVPRVILHSGVLNGFAAISTDFHDTYRRGKDLSKQIEWYSIEEIRRKYGIGDLWPDMVLVLGDSAEDLRIAADYFDIARPDVIVEVMEAGDWYQTGGLEKVKRHKDILKPRLGAFVVCRQPVPQAAIEELIPPPPPSVQSATPAAEGAGQPLPQAAIEELVPTPEQPVQSATPATEGASQPLPVVDAAPPVSAGEPCLDIHLLSVGYDASALEPIVEAIRQSRAGNS